MNTYNIKENLLEQMDFIESRNNIFKFTQSKKTTENILNFASLISRGATEEHSSLLNLVNNKINFREEKSFLNIAFLFSTIFSIVLFSISYNSYGILLLCFIPFMILDPRVRSLHSLKLLEEKLESPKLIKEIYSTAEKKFKNLYLTEKKKVKSLRQKNAEKDQLIKQSTSTSIKDKEFVKDLYNDIKEIKSHNNFSETKDSLNINKDEEIDYHNLDLEGLMGLLTLKDRFFLLNENNFLKYLYEANGSLRKTADFLSLIVKCNNDSAFTIVRGIINDPDFNSKNEDLINEITYRYVNPRDNKTN